jgi:hypothetical protein
MTTVKAQKHKIAHTHSANLALTLEILLDTIAEHFCVVKDHLLMSFSKNNKGVYLGFRSGTPTTIMICLVSTPEIFQTKLSVQSECRKEIRGSPKKTMCS